MTKEELFAVPIPIRTDYYEPIPHEVLFNEVYEKLYARDLTVLKEDIVTNANGEKLFTKLRINKGDDEKSFMLGFRNSYDKTMSLGFCAGIQIVICSNGMVSGEKSLKRRHQGTVLEDLREIIDDTVNSLDEVYEGLSKDIDVMKSVEVNKRCMSELTGRLFVEEGILTTAQVTIVRDEIKQPSFSSFIDPTLWSYYNYVTTALKQSHSMKMMSDHIKLHKFIYSEFDYNFI